MDVGETKLFKNLTTWIGETRFLSSELTAYNSFDLSAVKSSKKKVAINNLSINDLGKRCDKLKFFTRGFQMNVVVY